MPDTNTIPQAAIPEEDMTFRTKSEKIESCVLQLKSKGVSKSSAFAICTASINNTKKASEVDSLTKRFADTTGSFLGVTSKGGINKKHSHAYAVMILNWGSALVGVTTKTNGASDHIHTINITLDSKVIAIEARTDMGGPKDESDSNMIIDLHNHSFKADIESISDELPSIRVTSPYYFNEKGERIQGDVEKAFEEVTTVQATISDNTVKAIIDATKCSDNRGRYFADNDRQARILLNRIASFNDKPEWFKGSLDELQAKVFNSLSDKYENIYFDDNVVAEMIINLAAKGKINPKAKVRNKPSPVFPAGSSDVTDNKDHFPLGNEDQARNALARAAQYSKAPVWYKGSLAALQQKVRKAVKAKYPGIKVTGLSDFYAIRFKEDGDVFFIHLFTQNIEAAKHDTAIYFNECQAARVDLVKFTSTQDGESKFSEIGNVALYDVADSIRLSSSYAVNLAHVDPAGLVKIQMLPEGVYHHEVYGDLNITTEKLNEIVDNYKKDVLRREVAIDMNHLSELPAAGWIKKLTVEKASIADKTRSVLVGYIKPTKLGEESIRNEEFKYISAEYTDNFTDRETGKAFGTVLKGAGLTNRPWMPGLAPVHLSEIKNGNKKYCLRSYK